MFVFFDKSIIFFPKNRGIKSYNVRGIELNSLVFNPSLLPNEITVKSTINVIKALIEKSKEKYLFLS